jgi:hypothetical protein
VTKGGLYVGENQKVGLYWNFGGILGELKNIC